jgi:predicted deacylase
MRKEIRSYSKLLNEVINLNTSFRIEIIGYVIYFDKIYPMLALKYTSKMNNKTAIIQAGQHGDENYVINILMKWLKQPLLFNDMNYYIYPCINMYGYATGSRDNGARQDTNNDKSFYKDSPVKELAILYDAFPQSADIIIDLHGDGKENIYAYEHKSENLPSIVEPALIENDNIIPYVKTQTIYKVPVHNGVLSTPPYDIGIEGFMEKLGVTYTITLEFPKKFDGQKRAEGGVAIINSLLKNFKEIK